MDNSRICVLSSGGVESASLLYLLARKYREVYPLHIAHGYRWEKAERHWLRRFIAALRTPRVRPLAVLASPLRQTDPRHWSFSGRRVPSARSRDEAVYLPARNILLLSLAAAFCRSRGISRVAIGTLSTNPFPDSSAEFFRLMEKALSEGLAAPLKILRPFSKLRKEEIVRKAARAPLHLTFSCLNPKGMRACGRCNKCAEREKALKRFF